MPFVPRSQIEQQQANAAPPPMPVVENYPKQPTGRIPLAFIPQQTSNTEEQINELNELLVHVLDEISSMKDALSENARKKNKRQQRKKHVLSDDEDTSEDDQEEPPAASPPPKKTPLPPTRPKVHDFSSCF
jgi:hypothetical protein